MVVTILEGHIAPDKSSALEAAFRAGASEAPPGLVETFLLHSMAEATLWRIVTVWASREALEAMRKQGTPAGVLMFRAAGGEPTLSVWDVPATVKPS